MKIIGEPGSRLAMTDAGGVIAAEEMDSYARAARFMLDEGDLPGRTVAWIGGGFCVGPRLFRLAGHKQTVYEIEPALAEFCPPGVTFIPGDWRDTITGQFDVIVYDLGGEVPRTKLNQFLAPGGTICPRN